MKRKVIQIILIIDTEYAPGSFMALCDDGSIWERVTNSEKLNTVEPFEYRYWYEWKPIQGPPESIE